MLKTLALLAITGAAAFAQTPTIAGVVNSLSFSTTLCPGLLATVYGANFGTDSTKATATIGGKVAYVYSQGYAATQMDIQIPFELASGASYSMTVSIGGASSSAYQVSLSATSPAFTSLSGAGTGLATIYPANSTSNFTLGSPAQPGATVFAYVVGLGATTPATATGVVPSGTLNPVSPLPVITVGGAKANVLYAAVVPGLAGFYQVNFTLPATGIQGTVPIVISIGGQTSSSLVTIPITGLSSVVNNASFANPGTIAPGTIASIFANGLGSASAQNLAEFPNVTAEGVQVTFNGTPAPIFHIIPSTSATTPGQLDIYVPDTLPTTGTVNVQLTTSANNYPNYTLNMVPASPGFYRFTDPKTSTAYVIAQFTNSAWLALPVSTTSNLGLSACAASSSAAAACGEPANIGDYLTIYLTGLGLATVNGSPTGATLVTGQNPPANGSILYETPTMPTVTIGGISATPLFSGLVPGFAGEYQVNVQVPAGVVSGDMVPVVVTMNGQSDTAYISIQPSRVQPPNQ